MGRIRIAITALACETRHPRQHEQPVMSPALLRKPLWLSQVILI